MSETCPEITLSHQLIKSSFAFHMITPAEVVSNAVEYANQRQQEQVLRLKAYKGALEKKGMAGRLSSWLRSVL